MKVFFLPWNDKNPYQQNLATALGQLGVEVTGCRTRRFLPALGLLWRHGKPDVLHLHWVSGFILRRYRWLSLISSVILLVELLTLRALGVRIVWTIHNLVEHKKRDVNLELRVSRLIARICHGLFVHCEGGRDAAAKAYSIENAEKRVTVTPHGHYLENYPSRIDCETARTMLGIAPDSFVYLFFGMIQPYKGIEKLIEVFDALGDPKATLLVVGSCPNQALVTKIRAATERDPRIKAVLRYVADDEIQLYMGAANAVVLPFNDIFTSGSAVLAMGFGRAVVAPRIGCLPAYVDERGGILYQPGEGRLLEALQRIAAADWQSMGEHNRRVAESLDWSTVAATSLAEYEGEKEARPEPVPTLAVPGRRRSRGLTSRTVGGLGWTLSSSGAQAVLQIIVTAILARLLTPGDFGVVALALSVTGAGQFLQFGLGPALVQRAEIDRRHKEAVFSSALALSVCIVFALWLAGPILERSMSMPGLGLVIQISSLTFLFRALSSVGDAMLQREMRFNHLALINVTSYALGFAALGIAIGALGGGMWALVLANVGQTVLRSLLVLLATRALYPLRFQRAALRELLPFGTGLSVGNVISYVANQADYVIVGRILGASALGIYNRAFKLMVMPANLFAQSVERVVFPALASIQTSEERLRSAHRRGIFITAIVVMPISVLACVLAPEFVRILLGKQWGAAVVPLQILSVSMFFRVGIKIGDMIARATGRVIAIGVVKLVYASLIIGLALAGSRYGLVGVCVGVALAIALTYASFSQLGMRSSGLTLPEFFHAHAPGLVGGMTVGAVAWPVAMWLRSQSSPAIVTLALTSISTLVAVAFVGYVLRRHLHDYDTDWIIRVARPARQKTNAQPASFVVLPDTAIAARPAWHEDPDVPWNDGREITDTPARTGSA